MCPVPGDCQVAGCNDSSLCELQALPAGTPCGAGTCDDSAHCIPAGCQMQGDCDISQYCQAPTCSAKKPKHAECQQSFECASNDCHHQKCA